MTFNKGFVNVFLFQVWHVLSPFSLFPEVHFLRLASRHQFRIVASVFAFGVICRSQGSSPLWPLLPFSFLVFSLGFSIFLGLDVFSGSAFFFFSASFFSAGLSSSILPVLSSSVVTFSLFDVIVVSSSSSLSGRMYVSSSLVSSSVGNSGLSLSGCSSFFFFCRIFRHVPF